MKFEPLYFKEKLIVHNPEGRIGIVTLWNDRERFYQTLKSSNAPIDSVAVIGNLFGNGIRELLRNLLYNPQIDRLIVTGKDKSGAGADLVAFFEMGIDLIDGNFYSIDASPVEAARISTRERIIDSIVKPYDLNYLQIFPTADINETIEILKRLPDTPRTYLRERKTAAIPKSALNTLPSNPRDFNITREDVIGAWKELLFVIHEFGELVHLEKGDRKELQNVKVVIENPEVNESFFKYFWINQERVEEYQLEILSAITTSPYSYGNRIRAYFGIDALDAVVTKLLNDAEDRQCYITLWDNTHDILNPDVPCLVSLFFRKFQGKLTLTATFRTHNSLDAWVYNVTGMKAILDFVSSKTNIEPGAITIISHSITIDPNEIGRAKTVIENRHFEVLMDSRGYFTFDIESGEIICKRFSQDHIFIKEYREKKAEKLQHILYKEHAISDINHAIYVGRQLAEMESNLKRLLSSTTQ